MSFYGDENLLYFNRVFDRIDFPGVQFRVSYNGEVPDRTYWMQVVKPKGKCNVTGVDSEWKGRKWQLSIHATPGELTQTALKAVITAFEHEIRELFRVDGTACFQPHFDLDALISFSKNPQNTQKRTENAKNT